MNFLSRWKKKKKAPDRVNLEQSLKALRAELNEQYIMASVAGNMEGVADTMLKTRERVMKLEQQAASPCVLQTRLDEIDEKLSVMVSAAVEALQKYWANALSFALEGLEQGIEECRAEIPLYRRKYSVKIIEARLVLLDGYRDGIDCCVKIDQGLEQEDKALEEEEKIQGWIDKLNEELNEDSTLRDEIEDHMANHDGYRPVDEEERKIWEKIEKLYQYDARLDKTRMNYDKAREMIYCNRELLNYIWDEIKILSDRSLSGSVEELKEAEQRLLEIRRRKEPPAETEK